MKKFTLSLLLSSIALVAVTAQELPVKKSNSEGNCDQTICARTSESRPLVIVDGFETDMKCLALNPERIEKINVIKGKVAMQEYGSKGSFGVIVITTKPGTEFYTITDFVNPEKNLNKSVNRVQLDNELLTDMKKVLIDKSVFKQTMISAEFKIDQENCKLSVDDTLVVMTTLKDNKE